MADLRPISIIVTTLAARAYEYVVLSGVVYESDYDLLLAVVEHMPRFIQVNEGNAAQRYVIENETVTGENFAEKWNANPKLAKAFYGWHEKVLAALRAIADLEGQDQVAKLTSREFGLGLGERMLKPLKVESSSLRSAGQLSVHSTLGVIAYSAPSSAPVRSNTFHGR